MGEDVAALAIHSFQSQHVLAAETADRTRDIRLAVRALAKLPCYRRSKVAVRGTRHQLQRGRDFIIGEHVEERRLPQRNGKSRLQCVVKYAIARAIRKVGENDSISFRQALAPMRAEIKRAGNQQSGGGHRSGNQEFPVFPSGCLRQWNRGCPRILASRHSGQGNGAWRQSRRGRLLAALLPRCDRSGNRDAGDYRIRVALQAQQLRPHLSRALVAQLPVFLQRPVDDVLELGWNIGIHSRCRDGRTVENRIKDYSRAFAAERKHACRHFVQHHSERKKIGAGIERLGANLFRGHISHRAQHGSGPRQEQFLRGICVRFRSRNCRRRAGNDLSQSKIQYLCVTALGDENVCRLDVTVNDALGMRGVQPVGDVYCEYKKLFQFQRLPLNLVLQSHAVEKLHADERFAIFLAEVVNRADIGVVKRRGGLCFALKSAQNHGIAGHVVRQKFQRDKAVQASVFGLVDNTHSAAAELFRDAVVRKGLPNEWLLRFRHGPVILGCRSESSQRISLPCLLPKHARFG